MRLLIFVAAMLLPNAATADEVDDLLGTNCMAFLRLDTTLLDARYRTAEAALRASWTIFKDAYGVEPPIEDICDTNPQLTAGQAMKEAIAAVKN